MEDWRKMEPTEKQLEFIEAIENAVGVEFVGKTCGEACEFISDNRDEFDTLRRLSGGVDCEY